MTDFSSDPGQLERRLAATSAVGSIVHAIWALASAELPRVEALAVEASTYLDWIDELLARVAGPEPHAAADPGALRIVLGPERSFCGALARRVAEQIPQRGRIALVGRRLVEAASREDRARAHFALAGASTVDELEAVADEVAAAALGAADEHRVELLYATTKSRRLRRATLLPAQRVAPFELTIDAYSSSDRVLSAALRASVTGRLRVALAETLRAEVRARAAAAEAAQRAVDGQRAELELALRVTLQEQVTTELVDLYAGVLGCEPVG